jgi:hypothetical protein
MQRFVLLAGAAALTAFGASAFAQGGAAGGSKGPSPRTAASIECSRQADVKGLHGTARKHFRSHCMRNMARTGKAKGGHGLGYR